MPRTPRAVEAGTIYHIINRGNGRMKIFHKPADYQAFIKLLGEAQKRGAPVDLLGFCLMPNHWHLVLRPKNSTHLAKFMRWLSTAHVRRHHAHYHHAAGGHLYQGRYKSFPVQNDLHFLTVMRYVEANAKRAGLVRRATNWRHGSAALAGTEAGEQLLAEWPLPRPANWMKILDEPFAETELQRVHTSVNRGQPFGSDDWVKRAAKRLGLEHTLRERGRPKKKMAK